LSSMLLSLRQNPFLTLQKSRGVSVTRVFCDHSCFSSMAMGAMAALHGLAWCLGSLQKLPQSCRAVRTGLKDNPLCYCEARMWLIAIRIHIFPPCVKSLYVSYNHHFWASSQPQNRFSFTISGSHLANIPMKVESSKSTPFSRHVVILLFCTKHGSWSVLSRGITYRPLGLCRVPLGFCLVRTVPQINLLLFGQTHLLLCRCCDLCTALRHCLFLC
jgi:hypothetical protein